MIFILLPRSQTVPSVGKDIAYLQIDNWNDYSFETLFSLVVFDENGTKHKIGNVKIGFRGQTTQQSTHSSLAPKFESLPEGYFSLGEDVEYYKAIVDELSLQTKESLLNGLNDIVLNTNIINEIKDEEVFGTSLLRYTSLSVVKGQLVRILNGDAELTPYNFGFIRHKTESLSNISLEFQVIPESKPKTNIHTIIGRNGVGKTTLLNGMIASVIEQDHSKGYFFENTPLMEGTVITKDYFSSIVSVSFSVFDPFDPPIERADPSKGTCYYYIGLKQTSQVTLKNLGQLHIEFYSSLRNCFVSKAKKERWLKAVKTLESDSNFADMNLGILATVSDVYFKQSAIHLISKMSSGHAIVILTLTKLVEKVEEKTLLLIDEPESHLHPPLLSAFTRALSDLLSNRNGVAIIATHSPVVLQETPKNCVSKITRYGESMSTSRPRIETFAENVGILTREVFGLEVKKSGFHELLQSSVDEGSSYQEILTSYEQKLGIEGQFLLQSMIANRETGRE